MNSDFRLSHNPDFILDERVDWHFTLHHFKGYREAVACRARFLQMIPADVRANRDSEVFGQIERIKNRPVLLHRSAIAAGLLHLSPAFALVQSPREFIVGRRAAILHPRQKIISRFAQFAGFPIEPCFEVGGASGTGAAGQCRVSHRYVYPNLRFQRSAAQFLGNPNGVKM